jgi:hypothetical protein
MGNNLYLLEYNKNTSIVSFNKKIKSLEFVEPIGNMDLNYCINYRKRDIYLKRHGKQLFEEFKMCKDKRNKIQIKIEHEIVKIFARTSRKNFISTFLPEKNSINSLLHFSMIRWIESGNINGLPTNI